MKEEHGGGGMEECPQRQDLAVLSMQCGKIFQHTLLHVLGLKDSTLHRMLFITLYQGGASGPPRPCWDPEHKVTPYASISLCSEEQLLVSQEAVEKQMFRVGSG